MMRSQSIISSAFLILAVGAALSSSQTLAAQAPERTIFVGKPTVRLSASEKEANRQILSDAESIEYACRIVQKEDGKYYWASREYREMELVSSSKDFWVYLIAKDGTGFVKLLSIPPPDPRPLGDDSADYMESLTITLKSVTYWGRAVRHRLP